MLRSLILLVFALVLLSACQTTSNSSAADLIIHNARVYTVAEPEWAEAIAINEGRIIFVGDSAGAKKLADANSRVIDLNGAMLMPGINDAHLHPVIGAMKVLFQCNFPFSAKLAEVQETVSKCASTSEREWITGGQWDSDFFLNNNVPSPRAALDKVSGDKAVFLSADSGHDAWLNSKALEIAGITRDTKDPEGGTIVRDEQGEPNGLLLEKAQYLVQSKLPPHTKEEYVQGAHKLMEIANGFGVTGMKDASADESDIRALATLAGEGALSAHMAMAINVGKDQWSDQGFSVNGISKLRDQYATKHLDTRFAKIFLDGVPTSSRTASMLADYLPANDGDDTHSGDLHFNRADLTNMLTALDSAGYTVKVHTAGDGAVRVALDALEQVRKVNGQSGLRHELAHAGYIAPNDIPRFHQLNVVADFSPFLWHPSPIIDSIIGAVGPRALEYWPTVDLLASDAAILAGSDWPSAVASMNPWYGIEALVTRADPNGVHKGQLWQQQAISLKQALKIFTLDGATALRLDHDTGSIEVGKLADFIVLSDNVFEGEPSAIGDTEVMNTVFGGKIVFAREGAPLSVLNRD